MFSLLRTVLIIGAIYYFSPVRDGGDVSLPFGGFFGLGGTQDAAKAPGEASPARLESLWRALPEPAKDALIDRILSPSGRSSPAAATDTLRAADRMPPWGGAAEKPAS